MPRQVQVSDAGRKRAIQAYADGASLREAAALIGIGYAAIRRLFADAGVPLRRQGNPGPRRGTLTGPQREALQLLADGLTTAQMADKLRLSLSGAQERIQRARETLGAPTRIRAVVIAAQTGQIRVRGLLAYRDGRSSR